MGVSKNWVYPTNGRFGEGNDDKPTFFYAIRPSWHRELRSAALRQLLSANRQSPEHYMVIYSIYGFRMLKTDALDSDPRLTSKCQHVSKSFVGSSVLSLCGVSCLA